jgi:hypothetical protein
MGSLDPDPEGKNNPQKRKTLITFNLRSAGCSLLRVEGKMEGQTGIFLKTSLCILRRGRPVAEGGWACRAGTCAGSPAAPGSHSRQECGRAPARNHTPDHRKGPGQHFLKI